MKRVLLLCFVVITIKLHSLYVGIAMEGYPSWENYQTLQKNMRINPDIVLFYISWPSFRQSINLEKLSSSIDLIKRNNAIACITWEPMFFFNGEKKNVSYRDILHKKYDHYIEAMARLCKSKDTPILLRFAHEMNLSQYHWGTNADSYNAKSPDLYKKIYRHVINIFKKENVKNVLFVFCPNCVSIPDTSWNIPKNYYPGRRYVDILGMDGYNWGRCMTQSKNGWTSSWQGFSTIFSSLYQQLRKISSKKPIMVFETASSSQGGDRKLWLRQMIEDCKKRHIEGIVWFQINKECSWALSKDEMSILQKAQKDQTISIQQWAEDLLQ